MTQENIPPQEGSANITRREFLIKALLAALAVVSAVAESLTEKYAFPFGAEVMKLTQKDELVDKCNEYMSAHDSLRQYTTIGLPPIKPRVDVYQTIIQNPSQEEGKCRIAFSEGVLPTVCFINHDGVCDYNKLYGLLSPENVENLSDAIFVSPQQLEDLRATIPLRAQENRSNVLVLGDSWTRWNGFEVSYPAMLQTLCDLSGKNVDIIDASATGQGVTDYHYLYEHLKSKYHPREVLWTYHPNTDARFDAPRANMSAEEQKASIGIVGGLRNPEPIIHSATNLLRRLESRNMNMFTTLKALLKRVIKKSYSDALISTEELKEYTRQADAFTKALASDGVPSHLVGLPVPDLGRQDEAKYELIWDTISAQHETNGGHSTNVQGHFPSNYFDEYTHPTASGCLELSIVAYQQLFNENPPEDIVRKTVDIHTRRMSIMNDVRKQMQSSL